MTAETAIFTPMAGLVALQFLLYAVGWVMLSGLLRSERAATLHWGGFMLLLGLGFVLASLRTEPRTWLAYVGSDVLIVLGFAVLCRGTGLFWRSAPRDAEQGLVVAAAVAGLLWAGPGPEGGALRVLMTYGGASVLVLRSIAVDTRRSVAEFGRVAAHVIAFPGYLLVAGFAVRVVQQLLAQSQGLELHRLSTSEMRHLFAYMAGAAFFNFSFMAVVTSRLVRRLREQTRQDPLTGLPNRRALERDLDREWQALARQGRRFAVLALDLDHFKRVNDQHGHLAGDTVLEQTADRLCSAVRSRDTVARTGGEEFVVLVPDTDQAGAEAAAQRLLDCVRLEPFDLAGDGPAAAAAQRLVLTVSIGVALAGPTDGAPQDVVRRADEALYQAKAQGRNRAVLAAG